MASIINATTTNGVAVQGDNSGSLQLQTNNGTTAVTIDTSQNVGIGTTTPLVPSSGRKVVTLNGTTDAMYNIGINGTYTGFFYSSASNTQLGSATNIPLQLYSNDVERMRIATDGTISTTIGSTLYGAYSARAWVNFNGTGTVAIRTSRNVSSITDNGTGDYTINFTTAMPDNEYAFTQHITCGSTGALNDGCDLQSIATGSFRVLCGNGGTALDANYAMFSIFR